MKKIGLLIILFIMSFMEVDALTASEIKSRSTCSKFEVAVALSSGGIYHEACYDNYNDAKAAMNNNESAEAFIMERVNGVTKVIDAKYALVYLDRGDVVTNLYTTSSVTTELTYMNNASAYGATDAAFLGLNYSNKAIKVKIGGATGWIKNGEYTIVPMNFVKSSSYYAIVSGGINHYYASNIQTTNSQSYRTLGPKPTQLELGNYYSYDGIYFYNSRRTMIDDYKAGNFDNSVNKDNAYYNYYMYLPHRSKTNYDIDDLELYIRSGLGYKGSIYGKTKVDKYSALYGAADYYMNAEKLYGANAISVFGLSRNESADGRSSIAINKNNVFGHNAVDGTAYSSSTGYIDVRSSIYSHAYSYINYGYSEVADWRYNGGHFGNKNSGMNVEYASDVFWGEKAANYYYKFDKYNGMLDYNYYQLAMTTGNDVNARSGAGTKYTSVYKLKKGIPLILVEEVHGETINGSDIWYKLQSDSNITTAGKIIGSNTSTMPEYNWDGYIYIHSSYMKKINETESVNGVYHYPKDVKKTNDDYKYVQNITSNKYTPKVGKVLENTDYYYSSSLLNKAGTILKDSYVTIMESANGDETNYLVITDLGLFQKHWISGENIEVIDKDLLKVDLSSAGAYINVTNTPGGSSVLKVYTNNQLVIEDVVTQNNKKYLKVLYKIAGSINYGYVDSTISGISYTLNYINTAPIIEASDYTITINSEFNPLDYVVGTDKEDGDITKNITVIENNVLVDKAGTYIVTYSLTDSYGETVTKKVNVTVKEKENKQALFMYNSLSHKENNIFNISGFMGIQGMDNINVSNELIFVNENTKEEIKFNLNKWEEYPYEMESLNDTKKYNYSGGWFNSDIDLTNLASGDYTLYVKCSNGSYEAKTYFTNIAYMDMTRRAKGTNKEFLIDVDYTTLNSPLIFSVRDELISLDEPMSIDPMYNYFTNINLENNILSIKGTSHSFGVSFGINDDVKRSLVLENTTSFKRFTYDLGSINNGDYPITLPVSDNCDKTRAWYDNEIDLSNLEDGHYIMYIKNEVNGKTYYGEIIDVMYIDYSTMNNAKLKLSRNDNIRLRLELNVTS